MHPWESEASYNGCAIEENGVVHLVYRAESAPRRYENFEVSVSTVGHAVSRDGIRFEKREQVIAPAHPWERFGCEDPRVTKLGDTFYIFYTALSIFPFCAEGIRVAVAVTKDFKAFEKHPVTPFNAKAMALFPERIGGKFAAILTANTDRPPAKIAIALFDEEGDIWSEEYWNRWYGSIDGHAVPLQRDQNDHVELGAPPIHIKEGWLVVYAYIRNYFHGERTFGIEAAILDANDPRTIVARTESPLLVPREKYERDGRVPNVIFPSGAIIDDGILSIYYGATDTTCCLATCSLDALLREMVALPVKLERAVENPIIEPDPAHPWEAKATFNPAALAVDGAVHLLYRAVSETGASTLGYALSRDGLRVDERLAEPAYVPRAPFETGNAGEASGCEDPRLTRIDDTVYLCYTAYDGKIPRVAISSIALQDFLSKRWNWSGPSVISSPRKDDKNAAVFPEKFKGKFAILHRVNGNILIDFVDDPLALGNGSWLGGTILMKLRPGFEDCQKIGTAAPPIETKDGWLLLYHGVSNVGHYQVFAALLDREDPTKVLARTIVPILSPQERYEREGSVSNVVFPCGAVVIGDALHVYYGGADRVVAVATVSLSRLLATLRSVRLTETKTTAR